MGNNGNNRGKRIVDGVLDTGTAELTSMGIDATRLIFQEVREWAINRYKKFKSKADAEVKLEQLQRYIEVSEENVSIGMDKKEIAVMWAMKKLGYTEEQMQELLDLANEAYKPKDKA